MSKKRFQPTPAERAEQSRSAKKLWSKGKLERILETKPKFEFGYDKDFYDRVTKEFADFKYTPQPEGTGEFLPNGWSPGGIPDIKDIPDIIFDETYPDENPPLPTSPVDDFVNEWIKANG